jgi:hypothetical protein
MNFSIGNAASSSLGTGYTSSGYTPNFSSDPLWVQILYGIKEAASIIDPYILTDQEKMRLELEKARTELERERLRSIQVQRAPSAVPVWVWVAAAVAGVVLLVVLLKE